MPDRSAKVALLHTDARAKARIRDALAAHDLRWVDASRTDPAGATAGLSQAAVIMVSLSPADVDPGVATISHLRRQYPAAKIIALAPPGDSALTRRAFRAGAWDCLEDPWPEDEVICSVVHAIDERDTVHPPSKRASVTRNGVTPLPGHSAFLDALAALRVKCRRHNEPVAVMMLDLDRFRDCNDRYSPARGDHVLRWFAAILAGACRPCDIITRYQSDRFIIALPGLKTSHARNLAFRCRQHMGDRPVVFDGMPHEMTMSVGIAHSTAGFIEPEQQLIRRARIALDHAKHHGGNRIVDWDELPDGESLGSRLDHLSAGVVSHWMRRIRHQLRCTYMESTRALVAAVEAKDPYTQTHSLTVATYAEEIGKRMKLARPILGTIRAAALLHDVGKIGLPDAILTKPGSLSAAEFNVVKRHPEIGLDILGHVSFLADERPVIRHHHERYDGWGYPDGLVGSRIPIGARVLAVADALDAMFSPRSYKPAYDVDRVRAELTRGTGGQFDPAVAEVALDWLDQAPAALSAGSATLADSEQTELATS